MHSIWFGVLALYFYERIFEDLKVIPNCHGDCCLILILLDHLQLGGFVDSSKPEDDTTSLLSIEEDDMESLFCGFPACN